MCTTKIKQNRSCTLGLAFRIATALTFFFILTGCGANLLKSQEKKDPAEDATIALENDNPDKAISILEDALDDDPGNVQYLSLLAMAYGQRAGVDPFSFIEKMGTSDDEGSSTTTTTSGNGMTDLFGIMPEATADTIADVDYALELLAQIPTDQVSAADKIKLALFQTAAMVLRVKILDVNGNGQIDPEEVLAMSAESALTVLTQMAAAATIFAGGLDGGDSTSAAGEKITSLQAAIAASEGSTDEEKLRSYIVSTN